MGAEIGDERGEDFEPVGGEAGEDGAFFRDALGNL